MSVTVLTIRELERPGFDRVSEKGLSPQNDQYGLFRRVAHLPSKIWVS